jgi:hypothetical protein
LTCLFDKKDAKEQYNLFTINQPRAKRDDAPHCCMHALLLILDVLLQVSGTQHQGTNLTGPL